MIERIVLFKLKPTHASPESRARFASALAEALRGRLDASVGVPADAAAEKSWDLSIVVRLPTLELAQAFDPVGALSDASGVPASDLVEVTKSWVFRQPV